MDSQLEVVWGVGVALWALPTGTVTYPLLTQLVEISLDEATMALEIRPRASEPRLEVDLYAAMDNPGVAPLVEAGRGALARRAPASTRSSPALASRCCASAATLLDASRHLLAHADHGR